jgi:TetR/AcrR family transcriptional repressor of nem operon
VTESTTAREILDAAQELAQTCGYHGFSYRDLEGRVGVRAASIHYHFPSKGDLGRALLARYRASLFDALAAVEAETLRGGIDAGAAAPERLRRYAAILEDMLAGAGATGAPARICLGGMLASDYATLPTEVQAEVTRFVRANEAWLARVLAEGRAVGMLAFAGSPEDAAAALFAAFEGAMMTTRSGGDPGRFARASAWLLGALAPVDASRPPRVAASTGTRRRRPRA